MHEARILGIHDTEIGKLAPLTTWDLIGQSTAGALMDAALDIGVLDGILCTEPMVGGAARHAVAVAEYLGLSERLTVCETVKNGGAAPLSALVTAFDLVESGRCQAVLVLSVDTVRTGQDPSRTLAAFAGMRHAVWEQPFGMTTVSAYALMADAYLRTYGLGRDDLASIPVELRRYAMTHPGARHREPLTVDEVVASRPISTPLRLLECPSVSDGGGAVIVGRPSIAANGRVRGRLLGSGRGTTHDSVAYATTLDRTGCSVSSGRALTAASVSPADIDFAMLYDSYSIAVALQLEEIGFCPPGQAPAFVAEGGLRLDGPTPVNMHGGLLSHGHCGSAAGIQHITEAVRQFRGEAVNQVPSPELALLHGEGGVLSTNCTAVLAVD
ncbi:thiolase family protein [Rhizomonospora bruguierae]|uniref:thiolase family protein n=1 Tax=Rhizomonospora bruguierae TaxID=1581705 RepID=UPI001BCAB591|nr:thiolase family protein [Micromonospora sp. NBRC 107566]